jgi:tryptophan synthase beta chain
MRDWMARVEDTHYIIGSVAGPHPFPMIVRDFQSVIGAEAREQILAAEGHLPEALIACVGGGSNSMGLFHAFYEDAAVKFYGVEAAGLGVETGKHCCSLGTGSPGVFHGSCSYVLQTDDGQIRIAHSISAGLDYPGVGPAHSFYKESGRAEYVNATDDEALEATRLLCQTEGIIPALESAHALAYLSKLVPTMKPDQIVIVCLSGRGDKDVSTLMKHFG